MDQSVANWVAGVVGASLVTYIIVGIVVIVLQIIAWWKLFSKATGHGWQSIIPVYNEYKWYKITWSAMAFWIGGIAIPVVLGILLTVIKNQTANNILYIGTAIYCLVFHIISCKNISKAYGHGAGFTIGLIFLPTLFMLILGLGKSEYVGPKGIKA